MSRGRAQRNTGFVGWFARSHKGIIVALVAVMAAMLVVLAMQHVSTSRVAAGAHPGPIPTFTSAPSTQRAVFIGDSYTAGAGASDSSRTAFAPLVAKDQGWKIVNLGRGGTGYVKEITDGTAKSACGEDVCHRYADMIQSAVDARPDVVVVSGGRNDSAVSEDSSAAAVRAFYQSLRAALPDSKIYAVQPIWDSSEAPESIAALGAVVDEAVRSVGGDYLAVGSPLAGHPDLISDDGVHPNDDGHQAVAAAVSRLLDR